MCKLWASQRLIHFPLENSHPYNLKISHYKEREREKNKTKQHSMIKLPMGF